MKSQIEIDHYERIGELALRNRITIPLPRWVLWLVVAEVTGALALTVLMLGGAIARVHGWL